MMLLPESKMHFAASFSNISRDGFVEKFTHCHYCSCHVSNLEIGWCQVLVRSESLSHVIVATVLYFEFGIGCATLSCHVDTIASAFANNVIFNDVATRSWPDVLFRIFTIDTHFGDSVHSVAITRDNGYCDRCCRWC